MTEHEKTNYSKAIEKLADETTREIRHTVAYVEFNHNDVKADILEAFVKLLAITREGLFPGGAK